MSKQLILVSCLSVALSVLPIFIMRRLKNRRKFFNTYIDDYAMFRCLFIMREKRVGTQPFDIEGVLTRLECKAEYIQVIVNFLMSATQTVELCMNHCTLNEILVAIQKLHAKGITVRLIIDKEMTRSEYRSIYQKAGETGISCKYQPTFYGIMHHKFCVIDGKDDRRRRVMFGSLNLTKQALLGNFEHMVLTNDVFIVKRFSDTFEEFWKSF